jgi:hypothetical protein
MVMSRRAAAFALTSLFLTSGIGCKPPEGRVARVSQLRLKHEVRPAAYQPRVGANGEPQLALDVLVVNRGREKLRSLTLLVVVIGADAKDRASKRVTVDTSGLVPGVTAQLSAVVEGLDVREGETVVVELEVSPPEGELNQFPEYAEGVS